VETKTSNAYKKKENIFIINRIRKKVFWNIFIRIRDEFSKHCTKKKGSPKILLIVIPKSNNLLDKSKNVEDSHNWRQQ
jgi:hypothetical protein